MIEKEKSRPDELTYAELLQLTKTYAEQSFQEHSGESSGTESDNSGPIPSTSKGHLAPHKRRNQMRVREGRKKFRPDEKKSAKSFDRERKV